MSQSSENKVTDEVSAESAIKSVHYCQGTTKKGLPCRNKVKFPAQYCGTHVTLFKYNKPAECPYCCESSESCHMNQPLSCGHWMCRKCMLRWKTECPECRRPLQVTKKDRKIMEHNTPISAEDQEAANMQAAIQVFLNDLQVQSIEGEDTEDTYWGRMSEDDGDVDLLSALIVGQALTNIRSATQAPRHRFFHRIGPSRAL